MEPGYIIAIVLFVLAAVLFGMAVILWFKFKILDVINDLSGRSAQKSIAQMREANEKTGLKSFRPSPSAKARGTITDVIATNTAKIGRNKGKKVSQPHPAAKAVNAGIGQEQTQPLNSSVIQEGKTEVLQYAGGTQVLDEGTTVLSEEKISQALNVNAVPVKMLQDIVFVHTQEVI